MGIELKNWMESLGNVAGMYKPSDCALPAEPEDIEPLVTAFSDAVLRLYNNSLRACGIEVGDAVSESNSMMIRNKLGDELEADIREGLEGAHKALLARMEADEAVLKADVDRLMTARVAASNEVQSLTAAIEAKVGEALTLASRIGTLRESLS